MYLLTHVFFIHNVGATMVFLSKNQIQDGGIHIDCPQLGMLALDGNQLTDIKSVSFDKLPNLKNLNIMLNPLENCGCGLVKRFG